jgi:hypothetical protein
MEVHYRLNKPILLECYMDLMNAEWKDVDEGYRKITTPETYRSTIVLKRLAKT